MKSNQRKPSIQSCSSISDQWQLPVQLPELCLVAVLCFWSLSIFNISTNCRFNCKLLQVAGVSAPRVSTPPPPPLAVSQAVCGMWFGPGPSAPFRVGEQGPPVCSVFHIPQP